MKKVVFTEIFIKDFKILKILSYEKSKFLVLAENQSHKKYILKFSTSKNEAYFLKNINQRSIIKPEMIFTYSNYTVIAMPYQKCDLYALLSVTSISLNLFRGLKIMTDLLEGLCFLHENSVLHGDIKLENILIGEAGNAMFCDFENARVVTNDDVNVLQIDGLKTVYTAPEKFGRAMPAEIYALGVSLHYLWAKTDQRFSSEKNKISQLLNSLLDQNPDKRPTARMAYEIMMRLAGNEFHNVKLLNANSNRSDAKAEVSSNQIAQNAQ